MGHHELGELVFLRPNFYGQSMRGNTWPKSTDTSRKYFGDHKHPFIFQHENAPAHRAHLTEQWLENNVQSIMWPSWFPDLNRKSLL